MMTNTGHVKHQSGMALVMGLIILLVMTLISMTAMRSTIMQERMAGTFQGQQMAFQAAEAALRAAHREVENESLPFGKDGYYRFSNPDPDRQPPDFADPSIDAEPDEDFEIYEGDLADNVAREPQYFIEQLPGQCKQGSLNTGGAAPEESFRIMVRGFGANTNNQVVLESYYCR
jgi:type IV pilus assembly protein PilX